MALIKSEVRSQKSEVVFVTEILSNPQRSQKSEVRSQKSEES
ncbi:hypothetical protein [Okeania sp. SIO3B5]|nr:hypothetical protein [Okeania sp. SIO3B5]